QVGHIRRLTKICTRVRGRGSTRRPTQPGTVREHVVADPRTGRRLSLPPRPPMIRRHGPVAAGDAPVPPDAVRVLAPAKVNLFLEILGKRPDGYHEIATLMLAIDLADELDVAPSDSGELSLTSDDPALSVGDDNL